MAERQAIEAALARTGDKVAPAAKLARLMAEPLPVRARDGLLAGLFLAVWLVGCGGERPPAAAPSPTAVPAPPEEAKPVACMQRTGPEDAETLLFDEQGNLLQSEHRRGDLRGATRYHRAPTGELLSYEVTGDWRNASGTFVYGRHKELVAVRLTAPDKAYLDVAATLRWRGAFAAAAGINRPFSPHGGAGGATVSGHKLLAANLKVRQPANPMPPMSFTGRVTVTYVSSSDRRETYDYTDGRLVSWVGMGGARASYRWDDADNLVEQTWCEEKDPFTGEQGECQTATARVESGVIRKVTIRGASSSTELSFDDRGRATSGRSNVSGSERSDSVAWSDCPVPSALPPSP